MPVKKLLMLGLTIAALTPADGAFRLTRARNFPDIGLAMPLPAGFAADPLEMPKASGYLVTQDGETRFEDRFDALDLWQALVCRGCWRDDRGAVFRIFRLTAEFPQEQSSVSYTRRAFFKRLKPLDARDTAARREAVKALAPAEVRDPVRPRWNGSRRFVEIWRYPTDDPRTLVYAFRPRSPERRESPDWYVVTYVAAETEDTEDLATVFEQDFLEQVDVPARRERPAGWVKNGLVRNDSADETELLEEAYRRNVANYDAWHFLAAGDILVTDDLDDTSRAGFLTTLTNNLPRLRTAYARALPAPAGDTFHPAAVRVFRSREEYLAYVGVEAKWTAALWSPVRRELVLYLTAGGVQDLLRNVYHEAFHQYLAYAGTMLEAAPWINEGHAQLFEYSHFDDKGELVFDKPPETASFIQAHAEDFVPVLEQIFAMDYEAFYAGSQTERIAKYQIAWSLAYFLEVGASEVRFRPFENLRADYMRALRRVRGEPRATPAVLTDELREDLLSEWLAFWRKE